MLMIICEFEKCDFISMRLTNLGWFQLIALALMQVAWWPIERGVEKGGWVLCGDDGSADEFTASIFLKNSRKLLIKGTAQ
jgi:hypothetical protein